MSHFTVLVVGEDVEGQLAPYHEFECTGVDDQYVQTIDKMDEYWEEYCKASSAMVQTPEGEYLDRYDDQCYRDPTPEEEQSRRPFGLMGSGVGGGISWSSRNWGDGRGHRPKVHQIPEGWTEVELPTSEVQSFAKFINDWYGHPTVPHGEEPDLEGEHKYGYVVVDELGSVTEAYDRTNPNAKWDWWVIGGRWTGYWLLKPKEDMTHNDHTLGRPGAFGNEAGQHTADAARKCDIDFLAMRDQKGAEAGLNWAKVHEVIAGRDFLTWSQMREKFGLSESKAEGDWAGCREAYKAQPVVMDLHANRDTFGILWDNEHVLLMDHEAYVDRARRKAIQTFAVVMDGKWYQRAEMGWWGMTTDEMDEDEWEAQYAALLEDIPDHTMLTVVDCHI